MASSRHLADPSTGLCEKLATARRYVWNWFIEGLRDEIRVSGHFSLTWVEFRVVAMLIPRINRISAIFIC